MGETLALIGFGEAATAFVSDWPLRGTLRAYDIKIHASKSAEVKLREMARADVTPAFSMADALVDASAALCLVTADQALVAARDGIEHIAPGALWFDMNSVAPDTKREAAVLIEAAGGRYVDVAVLAPVYPSRSGVPLLVSGPHALDGAQQLVTIGFKDVRVVKGDVGRASAIKMIRSVMIKGIEALTAECVLAASKADVLDEVLASLDANPPKDYWRDRADYNLDRMIVHGVRRAAEMEEVVKTLEALGTASAMTRATVERQRAIGEMGLPSPAGLENKIAALAGRAKHEDVS
jgi:3-hydroxyisobutyrate dehydrogenase-like beta-hydroxyacid dehydrogenase